jgi:hypothetical protein
MQVGAGYPPAPTHRSDTLSCPDGLSLPHIRSAEMEVGRYETCTVIDVNRAARQIEIRYQSNHPAASRQHRFSDSSGEVGSQMAALHLAVENSRGPKRTGDTAGPRDAKRPCP